VASPPSILAEIGRVSPELILLIELCFLVFASGAENFRRKNHKAFNIPACRQAGARKPPGSLKSKTR